MLRWVSPEMNSDTSNLIVRLAENEDEINSAQRLRYRVFVEEMGADTSPENHALRRETDQFDPFFDHLILIDRKRAESDPENKVVGVYRLMQGEIAAANIGFYGASEYDLSKLLGLGRKVVELGRSCVDKDYRGGIGMHMMWDALGDYVVRNQIEIMFGVASFHGTDPNEIAHALSYLHHKYLAPEDIRVTAKSDSRAEMDILPMDEIDRSTALKQIPSLIKGYLRLGGFVGDGAYIDHEFNTIDVCLLMDTERMSQKRRAYFAQTREGQA